MATVDWAGLHRLGFSVFPLRERDKKPWGKWRQYQDQRPSDQDIATWSKSPAWNCGIATGQVSGIIVLDVDSKEADDQVRAKGIPETPTVRTGKGKHYYFQHPGGTIRNFAGRVPRCDLRGDGGYVVAAGSVHPNGHTYEWEVDPRTPFAAPPAWLMRAINGPPQEAPPAPTSTNRYAEKALDGELSELRRAQPGNRNHTLNRAAFRLGQLVGANALGRGQVESLLVATAQAIGLAEQEARTTVASGLAAGIAQPREIPEQPPRPTGRPVSGGNAAIDLSAERQRRQAPAPAPSPLAFVDPITWQDKPAPPREWVVPDWIPSRTVTALYGDGGVGKSLIAQQLMTAAATDGHWLGLDVQPCRALGVFCEDDLGELHRRQEAINRAGSVDMADLEDMRLISRVADDNLLMTFGADGQGERTPLFRQLVTLAQDFGAQLVVIDTAADVFGGNENIRNQVRQFIAALHHLAIAIGGAVVLCAHPSVSGLQSGHGFAGSTAWNNSVRSRLYLEWQEDPDGAVGHEERTLSRKKANYATTGESVSLRWSEGVLEPIQQQAGFVARLAGDAAASAFLSALETLRDQGRDVSASPSSPDYAPKVMVSMTECRGVKKGDLQQAMNRLFSGGQIRVEERNRYGSKRIVACETPLLSH